MVIVGVRRPPVIVRRDMIVGRGLVGATIATAVARGMVPAVLNPYFVSYGLPIVPAGFERQAEFGEIPRRGRRLGGAIPRMMAASLAVTSAR